MTSPPSLHVVASSGRIHVRAEDRDEVKVDRGHRHVHEGVVSVHGGSAGASVHVPIGTALVIGSGSGRVELEGELGAVSITTRSGRVSVASCAALDVRTVSGRVEIGRVEGDARITAGTGRVRVAQAGGEVHVATVSGRAEVAEAAGPVRVNTVSGRIDIALSGPADARADSVSGRVSIALPEGVHPEASLRSVSGRCSCEPDEGTDCHITARSVSGTLEVVQRP